MEASKLEEYIKTAYGVVNKVGIQEELLAVEAFKFALAGLSGDGGKSPAIDDAPYKGKATASGSIHEKIASALDMPADVAELFYDVKDGKLALNLPTKSIPGSASAAMREIAVILTVGRKHAGLGDSTSFELIRLACDEYGKLDKKNFAAAMGSMQPKLAPTGKGTERELVAKKPADDLAKEILTKYSQSI